MKKVFEWNKFSEVERKKILTRPAFLKGEKHQKDVTAIINEVKASGDKALYEFTSRFDKVNLDKLEVTQDEIYEAEKQVDKKSREAINRAYKQVYNFHLAQKQPDIKMEVSKGIFCKRLARPVQKVGLYTPGGTAPLISTVIMLGVPAQIAQCDLKVLCTPPDKNGKINPYILYAASLCKIDRVFKIGGAQAIAAMAYGTESVPETDKIFGPGNSWVTEAKVQVSRDPNGAALDIPAGPSEVLVIADDTSEPEFAAIDLLSQLEHGGDSQAVLVSPSTEIIDRTRESLARLVETLQRKDILRDSMENALFIKVDDINQAFEVSNLYAPEHLIVQIENAHKFVDMITCAGSVFLGKWTPESVGDYASGTNHVLPTYGFAKAYSGLSVESFQKKITVQELTREGLKSIGPVVELLAEMEKLDAHKEAVSKRLKKAEEEND
ncbi:MAG: histidinol dehydrogenase [Oligoflexia bacterium]|nr:histidinol dehydrogenase [Oligoflexia bacterium]